MVRLKAPREGETVIEDQVQGRVAVQNAELDDFVLLRSDGSPTYMLAVVVDDHDMGVTHVIRGDDHLNNAFRQLAIIRAMGWPEPVYAHVPLIHGPDGAKLSKRHGALGVDSYRDELGILPEALFNYLLRLGWGHGDDEIISRDDAVKWFGLDHVGRSPSRFDIKKLENLNGHYLREADPARLAALVAPKIEGADAGLLTRAMPVLTPRAKDLDELAEGASFLFRRRPLDMDEKAASLLEGGARDLLARVHQALSATRGLDRGGDGAGGAGGCRGRRREAWPGGAAVAGGAHRAGDVAGDFRRAGAARPRGKPRAGGGRDDGEGRIMAEKATLSIGGKDHQYDTLSGTVGPDVIDIRKLYAQADVFTYDPGFTSTASCQSQITYIDGDAGILLHRGYPIDQLAENSTFMEVCYLLLNGELPDRGRARRLHPHHLAPHHAARAAGDLLPRLPARRPPDGDHVRRRRRAFRFLS